jgi:hypothetical protein
VVVRSDVLDKLTNGTEAEHVRHSADPRFGFGLVRDGYLLCMQRLALKRRSRIARAYELHVQHLEK